MLSMNVIELAQTELAAPIFSYQRMKIHYGFTSFTSITKHFTSVIIRYSYLIPRSNDFIHFYGDVTTFSMLGANSGYSQMQIAYEKPR